MSDQNSASDHEFHLPGLDPRATPIVGMGLGLAGLFLKYRPRLAPLPLALTAVAALLLRDPERTTPVDADALFAPADGVSRGAAECYEHRFLHTDALQLSIAVSALDVAVQRSPISGVIEYLERETLAIPPLWRRTAIPAGERLIIGISSAWGPLLLIISAGSLGRQVIPLVALGDQVRAGERIAIARFGCRVDLLAPRDLIEWKPATGSRVRAGVTPIGQVVPL